MAHSWPEPVDPDAGAAASATPKSLRQLAAGNGDVLAAIAAGGAIGSLARWSLIEAWPHPASAFATSTWTINVVGAFALGVLTVLVGTRFAGSRLVRPFFGVGVLGGFTTFSTYLLDARTAAWAGAPQVAILYLFGSALVGFVAAWAGLEITRRAVGERR